LTTETQSVVSVAKSKRSLQKQKIFQGLGYALVWFCGFLAVAAVLWIIGYVLVQGLPVINLEFLTTRPAGGVSGEGGMSTTIVTTLYLVILTITIATSWGLALQFIWWNMQGMPPGKVN